MTLAQDSLADRLARFTRLFAFLTARSLASLRFSFFSFIFARASFFSAFSQPASMLGGGATGQPPLEAGPA